MDVLFRNEAYVFMESTFLAFHSILRHIDEFNVILSN